MDKNILTGKIIGQLSIRALQYFVFSNFRTPFTYKGGWELNELKRLFILILPIMAIFLSFSLSSTPIDAFVHIKNGHFFYKGKRLRLWGVNIQSQHVLNYKGAEATVQRLKQMGFNALHIWLPRGCFHNRKRKWKDFIKWEKGSQRGLDLLDYLIYCCKQEGIFVSLNLSLRTEMMTDDIYDLVPRKDIDKNTWKKLLRATKKKQRIALKYLDDSVKAAYILKMKYFLNRVNPYTKKRYAEEEAIALYELEDELSFYAFLPYRLTESTLTNFFMKKKWEKFLREKYGSTEELHKAWGELLKDEKIDDMKALIYPGRRWIKTP